MLFVGFLKIFLGFLFFGGRCGELFVLGLCGCRLWVLFILAEMLYPSLGSFWVLIRCIDPVVFTADAPSNVMFSTLAREARLNVIAL